MSDQLETKNASGLMNQPWDLLHRGYGAQQYDQARHDEMIRQMMQNQAAAANPYVITRPSSSTDDKHMGTFSIKKVGGGFVVVHDYNGKSNTHIAADLDRLRDLIASEIIANQIER